MKVYKLKWVIFLGVVVLLIAGTAGLAEAKKNYNQSGQSI